MGCRKLQYGFQVVYRKNLFPLANIIYNNHLDDKLPYWHKYQWDFIHDPQKIWFAWLQDEEEGEMMSITDLLEQIRKANQEGANMIEILKDECPQSGFTNVPIGDKKLSYLKIKCSGEMLADDFTKITNTTNTQWELKFGEKVLVQPSEKTKIIIETSLGNAAYYQFHEVKQNTPPAKEELTDNTLLGFAVLDKEAADFEDYLYPQLFYTIKNVPFYCQTDAAINGLDCRWCSNWNKCCNGDIDGIEGKNGTMTCSDKSDYGYNNCCFATSSYMITQFGKSIGTNRAYLANLVNNNDLRDGVTTISNLTDNKDIAKVIDLIKSKTPVVAGVFYADRYDDKDDVVLPKNHKTDGVTHSATCHFIVIVGYGMSKDGSEYFTFYDPATSKGDGASDNNILTINKDENLIKGKRSNDTKQSYILTEFRLP
jgi:hypothetical protein